MQNIINGAFIIGLISISFNHRRNKYKELENDWNVLKTIQFDINSNTRIMDTNNLIITNNIEVSKNKMIDLRSLKLCTSSSLDLVTRLSLYTFTKSLTPIHNYKTFIDAINEGIINRNEYKINCSQHGDFIKNLHVLDGDIILLIKLNQPVLDIWIKIINGMADELELKINSFPEIKIKNVIYSLWNALKNSLTK